MTAPVPDQILDALKALLIAAGTDAGASVHIDRTEETPFEAVELPAINLELLEEERSHPSLRGAAVGDPVLTVHTVRLVQKVYTRGGPGAAAAARLIAAQCEAALAADPTLGGKCSQVLLPKRTNWLRDDAGEAKTFQANVLLQGEYRTYSNNIFTPV